VNRRQAYIEEVRRLRPYFQALGRLIFPYLFKSDDRLLAWGLLLGFLASAGLSLVAVVQLVDWSGDFFDMLENRDAAAFAGLIARLAINLGAICLFSILDLWFLQIFEFRWRRWITHAFFARYLDEHRFHTLQINDYGIDNPDQRISVDIRDLTFNTTNLAQGFLRNLANAITFVGVLWSASGSLEFTAFGIDAAIPGYLVWVALIYIGAASWLGYRIGKPLTALQHERQRVEADFRFGLVQVRENAEAIALSQGDSREIEGLRGLFKFIRSNWYQLVRVQAIFAGFTGIVGQVGGIITHVANAPRFLAGQITLGGMMEAQQAFAQVQFALMWFLNVFPAIAAWKASVDRVLTLERALEAAGRDRRDARFARKEAAAGAVELSNLTVRLPNGRALVQDASLTIAPGARVLIAGQSGGGKTTLFRVLSGLWHWGEGSLSIPVESALFLPQKSYIPNGRLRDALCYPASAAEVAGAMLDRWLRRCALSHLIPSLETEGAWSAVLSGGEQQRVGILRALLQKPSVLLLDESTSALDTALERELYQLLVTELPETTIVSIAHREEVKAHHNQRIELDPQGKRLVAAPV